MSALPIYAYISLRPRGQTQSKVVKSYLAEMPQKGTKLFHEGIVYAVEEVAMRVRPSRGVPDNVQITVTARQATPDIQTQFDIFASETDR